ncbi:MAG: hypothetical protein NUV46_03500 [Nanoarchaeota archaeon]|nr:hypothetical protein [Nanoarchaeota archaeon]
MKKETSKLIALSMMSFTMFGVSSEDIKIEFNCNKYKPKENDKKDDELPKYNSKYKIYLNRK